MEGFEHMRKLLVIILCVILTSCSNYRFYKYRSEDPSLIPYSLGKQEKVAFAPPKQVHWKNSLDTSSSHGIVQRIFVPFNESPDDWTQSIYLSYYPRRVFHGSVGLMLKETQRVMKKICGETAFKILTSPRSYTIYTLSGYNCGSNGDRFLAGKVMQGSDGFYEIQYSALSEQIPPKYTQHGLNTVMSARLR